MPGRGSPCNRAQGSRVPPRAVGPAVTEPGDVCADRLITAIDQRRPAILDAIRSAKRLITLSLFRCNDDAVFEELAAATARGVAVEMLVTSRAKGGRKKLEKLWRALEHTGADVRSYTDPVVKYHPKYLVVDDGPAIVASLNFTKKCFRATCDALVITHDPDVVSGLRRLWAADPMREEMPADLTERLIVGPERARRQFTALIEGARSSIRLIDAKLSDPDLLSLLNAKRAAGVAVEVFSSKRLGALKSHGKIMLIDDRLAVVGSLALAALSLDFRREVAIIVDQPDAVREVIALFGWVADVAAAKGSPAGASDEASW
jgi:phosphatidylserine/phosphatidylglycerophosphate/cardiolipin synthase-like enzyme